jgi:non-canonical poly(A) RNA polymerase PAPD5/7
MARSKGASRKGASYAPSPPPAARLPPKPPRSNHPPYTSSTQAQAQGGQRRPSTQSLASRITGRERSYSPPRNINQSQPFRFGQRDSYRRSRSPMRDPAPRYDNRRPRERTPPRVDHRRDFSFRSDVAAPSFPQRSSHHHQNGQNGQNSQNSQNGRRNDRFNRNGGYRPKWLPPPTHNRPIIRALNDREKTPERLAGMVDTQNFRDLAELSESMDQSSDDEDGVRKRTKTETAAPDSVPRWSNPDPYALPVTDEQPRGKKTDVVQLIRKAKVTAAEKTGSLNDIADNLDFVPLDFGGDDDDSDSGSGELSENADQIQVMNGGLPITQYFPESTPNLQETLSSIAAKAAPVHQIPPVTLTSAIDNIHISKKNLKRKREHDLPGKVLALWAPTSGLHPTPWVVVDHSDTVNMGLW